MSNPAAFLESELLGELGELVGNGLHGRSARPSERLVQRLRRRPGFVAFDLRAAGRSIAEWWSEGTDQWEAVTAGIQEARSHVDARGLSVNGTLALCLCHPPEPVDPRSDAAWRAVNASDRRGMLGVQFVYGKTRERTSPINMVTTNRDVERLLQRFVEHHNIAFELVRGHVQISTFAADQLLVLLSRPPRAMPLTRGARLVLPSEITASHTQELADLLAYFLLRNVHDDGRITYSYHPSRGKEDPARNDMSRQWMATLALCQLAEAKNERAISDRVDRNIRYNLDHFYRCEDGCGLIEYGETVELGAIASAVLAIASHRRRGDHEEVETALWRTIDRLWQPTGAFRASYEPHDGDRPHSYYPGVALLAWAHRYRESQDPELECRFMKSFRYYRSWHLANRKPAFVPWHTQAYAAMWRQTRNCELADFVFEMNDWLLPMQQWSLPEYPEFAGRFHDPKRPRGAPRASSTGVCLQGLVDAHSLAIDVGDTERAENYRLAICRGVRSISQLVFRDDADLYYIAQRDRVRGGVRTTCYDNVIRIDNVQHALQALLKIVRRFEPEDFSCWPISLPDDPTELLPPDAPLQVLSSSVLEGANQYTDRTSVSMAFRWQSGAAVHPEFAERLRAMVPELASRIDELLADRTAPSGLEVARLVAAAAQALQVRVDCLSEASTGRLAGDPGSFVAAVVSEYPEVGRRALALAALIVTLAAQRTDSSPARYVGALVRFAKSHLPDPVRREIARVARSRGIPWERIGRMPDIFRLGTGFWQKRCDLTTTSNTSMVHAYMTANKPVSNPRLARLGIPVPRQQLVFSAEAALEAARDIGYPVVAKPWRGSGGHGVSANLVDESQLREGYARAARLFGDKVAIEEYLPGEDYRLLFINGEFVAACKRIPPHVDGDGEQTIVELVHAANRMRTREDGLWHSLHEYHIDQDSVRVLRAAGYDIDTVPTAGERVYLSSAANGGTTEDVTSRMHPDNVAVAARAARIAGIDVCGVDFLLPDPERSYRTTGGGICEVNYMPSLLVHMIADGGRSLSVVERLVDGLIPPIRRGRVPVGILLGSQPGLAACVAQVLGGDGVACASTDAVTVSDFRVSDDELTWPRAARMALLDPAARWVLLEPTPDQVLADGLVVDWCDVAVLGDLRWDPRPADKIVLGLASAMVVWDAVLSGAGADVPPERTIACSLDRNSSSLRQHLEQQGRFVAAAPDGTIQVGTGHETRVLGGIGATSSVAASDLVLAVATAWALMGDLESIARTCPPPTSRGTGRTPGATSGERH